MSDDPRYGGSAHSCDYIFANQIRGLNPRSAVDFGAGDGKMGRIIRECFGKECQITAIEGHEETGAMLAKEGPYDTVKVCLLQDWVQQNAAHYDLAIFGDVLEHLTPSQIYKVMNKCTETFDHIIIHAPLYEIFQESVHGNPLQFHQSYITPRFFDRFSVTEKHIVFDGCYTIMNVLIRSAKERRPFYRRSAGFAFHHIILLMQSMDLAKPFVLFLKKHLLRFKWILGR